MTDSELGQRLVLYIVLGTIGMSVVVITLFVDAYGFVGFPERLVRLALTITLGIYLFRGASWARQVWVVLYGAGAIYGVVNGFQLAVRDPIKGATGIVMGLIYGTFVAMLVMVPAVRAHFEPASRD